MGNFEKNHRP